MKSPSEKSKIITVNNSGRAPRKGTQGSLMDDWDVMVAEAITLLASLTKEQLCKLRIALSEENATATPENDNA